MLFGMEDFVRTPVKREGHVGFMKERPFVFEKSDVHNRCKDCILNHVNTHNMDTSK